MCNCEDRPCCGCGDDTYNLPLVFRAEPFEDDFEDEEYDDEPIGSYDLSDDGDALASAGFGTDEDYGYYGDE